MGIRKKRREIEGEEGTGRGGGGVKRIEEEWSTKERESRIMGCQY